MAEPPHRWRRPLPAIAALVAAAPALSGCFLIPHPDHHGAQALEAGHPVVGAWLGSWPSDGNPAIDEFEDAVGVRLDLVDVYLDWSTPFENVSHTLTHIASRGAVPIITWEAQGLSTVDIAEGQRRLTLRDGRTLAADEYLGEFAEGTCRVAQATDQPVLVRALHEMNGFWFAWGISHEDRPGHRPNSDESYRRAWIHIHDAFQSRCGGDVRFVWAVNHASLGPGASFTGAYPGDAYVDYLGIDGYNWGANADWGWQGFDTLFKPGYCAIAGLSDKPILVAEVASSEKGGDKAAWIRELYAKMSEYPRIRGFVWLHDAKYEVEIQGNMDWNVDSSPASIAAFSEGARELVDARDGDAPPPAVAGGGAVCGSGAR